MKIGDYTCIQQWKETLCIYIFASQQSLYLIAKVATCILGPFLQIVKSLRNKPGFALLIFKCCACNMFKVSPYWRINVMFKRLLVKLISHSRCFIKGNRQLWSKVKKLWFSQKFLCMQSSYFQSDSIFFPFVTLVMFLFSLVLVKVDKIVYYYYIYFECLNL